MGDSRGNAFAFAAGAAVATVTTLAAVAFIARSSRRAGAAEDDTEWVLIGDEDKAEAEAEAEAAAAAAASSGAAEADRGVGEASAVLAQHRPIGVHSPAFLAAVHAANDPHMGVENMGPLLHALIRFTKPRRVFEIGAGATSLYILQVVINIHNHVYAVPCRAAPRRAVPRRAVPASSTPLLLSSLSFPEVAINPGTLGGFSEHEKIASEL